MFRRVVTLVLLPCVLMTQSAAVMGHAHAGSQPADHALFPHIHLGSVPFGHSHDHGPDGHHHPHDDDDDQSDDSLPIQQPEPPPEHDSDAVFVVAMDAVVAESSSEGEDVGATVWLTVDPDSDLRTSYAASTLSAICGHPPPQMDSFGPLYVRHLALLI